MTNPNAAPVSEAEQSLYAYYQFPDGTDGYQRRPDPDYARRLLLKSAQIAASLGLTAPSAPVEPYVDPRESDPAGYAQALLRRTAQLQAIEAEERNEA